MNKTNQDLFINNRRQKQHYDGRPLSNQQHKDIIQNQLVQAQLRKYVN